MAITYSKTSDISGLFADIYHGSLAVERQREMIPLLVDRTTGRGMAPRILPSITATTAGTVAEGAVPNSAVLARTAEGTVLPVSVTHQFALTDERIETDPDDARRQAAIEAGFAMANYKDKLGVEVFTSFTESLGAGGSALTLERVASAMTILNQKDAPGVRYAVVAPYAWFDVFKQVTNVSANPISTTAGDLANDALRQYFVSNLTGARWFVNSNVGTSGTAGTVTNAVFAPTAILYDERMPLRFEAQRQVANRAWLLGWFEWYGYGIRRQAHGVKILSKASAPS